MSIIRTENAYFNYPDGTKAIEEIDFNVLQFGTLYHGDVRRIHIDEICIVA